MSEAVKNVAQPRKKDDEEGLWRKKKKTEKLPKRKK